MSRPSWDKYFMDMAHLASTRSTCLRRKVGAVAIKNKRVISTGYNGAPKNITSCDEIGSCMRDTLNVPSGERHELCWASHAEMNLVCQAACSHISLKGAIVYITTAPCSLCLKLLINAEIREIVYQNPYPDDLSKEIMTQCIEKGIMTFRIFEDE